MACPNCGCQVTYRYDNEDSIITMIEHLERCAACGEIFDVEMALDDDDLTAEFRRGGKKCQKERIYYW
jgi:predicted nucleic acid-binding Zn ribbon protein